jgi:hypothetical protein
MSAEFVVDADDVDTDDVDRVLPFVVRTLAAEGITPLVRDAVVDADDIDDDVRPPVPVGIEESCPNVDGTNILFGSVGPLVGDMAPRDRLLLLFDDALPRDDLCSPVVAPPTAATFGKLTGDKGRGGGAPCGFGKNSLQKNMISVEGLYKWGQSNRSGSNLPARTHSVTHAAFTNFLSKTDGSANRYLYGSHI